MDAANFTICALVLNVIAAQVGPLVETSIEKSGIVGDNFDLVKVRVAVNFISQAWVAAD
ncbi:uncharacterized protein ASCRUDRAFT_83199 [Ascoidea rubescens DSM 1968]|uniref:Uncharacterized protein n=1 Tax=Ascoidea rubescens DSM 1968 TaxID=1344418 RepID=A0A1D2V8P5_9ASCO|nr:hypothetical protein ASCRUDRAFT_83199 [Ascoidea rubescens DSM 1968]ODV57813.1 hypothetical protein ASCRUDRAFT_83199 [Ascoidea rubescens DSM 1968]